MKSLLAALAFASTAVARNFRPPRRPAPAGCATPRSRPTATPSSSPSRATSTASRRPAARRRRSRRTRRTTSCRCGVTTASRSPSRPTATATTTSTSSTPTAAKRSGSPSIRPDEYPYTFTADDKSIIFGAARQDAALNRQFPTGSQPELYEVAAAGGRPTQLLTTPAENVRTSANGQLSSTKTRRARRISGGSTTLGRRARHLDLRPQNGHAPASSRPSPAKTAIRCSPTTIRPFYYLSEESGTFNVHKMSVDGGEVAAAHLVQERAGSLPQHGE